MNSSLAKKVCQRLPAWGLVFACIFPHVAVADIEVVPVYTSSGVPGCLVTKQQGFVHSAHVRRGSHSTRMPAAGHEVGEQLQSLMKQASQGLLGSARRRGGNAVVNADFDLGSLMNVVTLISTGVSVTLDCGPERPAVDGQ